MQQDNKTQLTPKLELRGISESQENIIKGSKDSFVEAFETNIALVRQRFCCDALVVNELTIGGEMKTRVGVCFKDGGRYAHLAARVASQLESFDGAVKSAGDIERLLCKGRRNNFPRINYTERPDKAAANLADGYIVLIVENLPFCYIVPSSFSALMQAPEDYSFGTAAAGVVRAIRYASFFLALLVPAVYIAVMLFNQEMLPRELMLSIIDSKKGVPFPTPFEVMFMLISFELLVEAGLRMPKAVGQAVSIVGALVVGQAAVAASFISPSAIVVVALSAIAGFAVPNQDMANALRVYRFLLCVAASVCGLYGIVLLMLIMGVYIADIGFFGDSFIYPFAGSDAAFLNKDTVTVNTDE